MNKTTQGKEITKYNAVKHGVLKKVLLPDEYKSAKTIQKRFIDDYSPKSLTKELLVETLSIAYIRRQRAVAAERDYFMQVLDPDQYKEETLSAPMLPGNVVGDSVTGEKIRIMTKEGFKAEINYESVSKIEKTFVRYITACERQFYKALHELQRVQAVRSGIRPTSVAVDYLHDRD